MHFENSCSFTVDDTMRRMKQNIRLGAIQPPEREGTAKRVGTNLNRRTPSEINVVVTLRALKCTCMIIRNGIFSEQSLTSAVASALLSAFERQTDHGEKEL